MERKAAIITGGTSALGKALVEEFTANGWEVHATTRQPEGGDELMHLPGLYYHRLNLEDTAAVHSLMEELVRHHPVELLINNAGFVLSGPLEKCSDEQIRRQMEVNFFGSVFTVKALLPYFRQRKKGTVINISSLCGLVTFPMLSMYHASKWAIEGFTESLLYELEPFGIRVKLVEPGGIKENDYSASVEFAAAAAGEYDELLQRVHHSGWFPSFTLPGEIARQVRLAYEDPSPRLRYQAGDDCGLLYRERLDHLADEEYLDRIRKRISS